MTWKYVSYKPIDMTLCVLLYRGSIAALLYTLESLLILKEPGKCWHLIENFRTIK